MVHIPISFDCGGKKYIGHFTDIRGAAQEVWHLMDNKNYYLGRLRQANDQWVFDPTPKTGNLAEKAEFFGDYVRAWYQ
jgi:hypothetical protein